jgi:SAM-dependent methyltransferase
MIPTTRSGRGQRLRVPTDWDLYRFGLALGLRTLPHSFIGGLKSLILPVEYVRCAETRYVLQNLDVQRGHRVLDVGSPKLLSLFLAASEGAEVYATDLMDYFFAKFETYARVSLGQDRARYRMETQDARVLAYPDGHFDRVFSISAVEHIPDDGDSQAMREISRVLAPGGIACLTVPWSDHGYLDEFRRSGDPDVYWASSQEEMVFFQRAYDSPSLRDRLISSGGLELLDLSFWGERRHAVEDVLLYRRLPRILRILMFPAHFPLSRIFLQPLAEMDPSRKKVACLTLRKRSV